MRIKKTSQYMEGGASLSNVYGTSDENGYTQEYINGLETYSTTEQRIGTWIDGKPLYRKVLTSSTYASDYSITINNIKDIVKVIGIVRRTDYSNMLEVIPARLDNAGMSVFFGNLTTSTTSLNIGITWGTNWSTAFGNIILIAEYTKTTD